MNRLFVWLTALSLALFPTLSSAQMPPLPGFPAGVLILAGAGSGGGGACVPGTQATNFLARTTGLSAAETNAYCNLINGLVSDGIITGTMNGANSGSGACGSLLDALYILATNTTATAALNLCGTSYSLTPTSSPTFTADQGYTGNGSSSYLDSNFAPNTATTPNCVLNSCHISAYVLNNRTTGSTAAAIGAQTANGISYLIPYNASNSIEYGMQNNSFPVVANPLGTARGYLMTVRNSSTVNSVFQNGNTTAIATSSSGGVAIPTHSFTILAIHQTSITNFSGDQISAVTIGAGLTSTQMNQIATRINGYMTALGINVF